MNFFTVLGAVEVSKWRFLEGLESAGVPKSVLCEEGSEGGEAVSPPSGPQEGARDAEGGPGGVKMRCFWSA